MLDEVDFRLAPIVEAGKLAAMSRDLVELEQGWPWTRSRIARHIRSPEIVVLVAQF